MKKCFYVLAVAIFALAGCAKEVAKNEVPVKDGKMIFNAVIEQPRMDDNTKASLNRGGVFSWAGNEIVAFFTEDGTKVEGTVSSDGSTIEVATGEYVSAIFPIAAAAAKDKVSFNDIPAGQPVIVAQVSGLDLEFYHIGSIVNLKIADATVTSNIELTSFATTGDGSFSFDNEGVPALASGSTVVSASAVNATVAQLAGGVSISVPNANYSGFAVSVKTTENATYYEQSTTKSFDLSARSKLLNMKEFSIPTYTVAGAQYGSDASELDAGMFGQKWAPDHTENDMVLSLDGKYRKTFEEADDYIQFKVVENHSWSNNSWPSSNNYAHTVNSNGGEITIIFDPITKEITIDDPDTFTVAGAESLCGLDWNRSSRDGNMTMISENVYYKKYNNIDAGTYSFKIVKNHSWDTAWGANGSDFQFTLASAGAAEIYFYLDIPSIKVLGNTQKYVVAGSSATIFGTPTWDATSANNTMSMQDDGTYSITYPVSAADSFEYKIVREGTEWLPNGSANISCSVTGAGQLTINYNPTLNSSTYEFKAN